MQASCRWPMARASTLHDLRGKTTARPAQAQAGPRPPPAVPVTPLQESQCALDHTDHPPNCLTTPLPHPVNNKAPTLRHSLSTSFHTFQSSLSTLFDAPGTPPAHALFPERIQPTPPSLPGYIRLPPHSDTQSTCRWLGQPCRRLHRIEHDGRRSNAPHAHPPTALGACPAPIAHAAARMEVSDIPEWSRNVNNWSDGSS